MPPDARAAEKGDGKIAIYNFHEDEYAEIAYRDGKGLNQKGLQAISKIMRSRGDGKVYPIDPRLIELIDLIQDHFGAETVELISGYRSPAYNDFLRENGRGAARESLHKQGLAADIHIDEVPEEKVQEYAISLGQGGAGLYPKYYFVHVDVGEPKSWLNDEKKERQLIGTENNPNDAWGAVTEKDLYAPGGKISVSVTNNGYAEAALVKNIWLEGFRRGKWDWHEKISKGGTQTLKPGYSTTFEVKIPEDQRLGKYRLVFFTSRDFQVPPAYSNEFYVR